MFIFTTCDVYYFLLYYIPLYYIFVLFLHIWTTNNGCGPHIDLTIFIQKLKYSNNTQCNENSNLLENRPTKYR